MIFSNEQQQVFDLYLQGKNVFMTGSGGTGKSFLIKQIKQDAYEKGKNVQVCALTGCAAVLLNCKAKTLHSWAGIGLANGSKQEILRRIFTKSFSIANWKNIQILIVDEVSMMSLKLFELLDFIGKQIRRKYSLPFGGIQVIFSGDFYQLPPVGKKDEPETMQFCFESPLWKKTFPFELTIQLCKNYRQKDKTYTKILNQIREGKITRKSNDILLTRVALDIFPNEMIKPTQLFPTKHKVENVNQEEMSKITSIEKEYRLEHVFDLPMTEKEKMIRLSYTQDQIQTELLYLQGNLLCDTTIQLKIGCQVMCIVNILLPNDDLICNGSQGIVIRFNERNEPIVKYYSGYEMTMKPHIWESDKIPGIGISQVPLILAWALTIHKAQGSTLDIAEADVGSGIFECGQTYVALSRVKSLDGLYLTSFDCSKILVNKKVQQFYSELDNFWKSNNLNNNILSEVVANPVEMPIAVPIAVPIAIAIPNSGTIEDIPILTAQYVQDLGMEDYSEVETENQIEMNVL